LQPKIMQMKDSSRLAAALVLFALCCAACNDPFDLQPWELDVPREYTQLNETAIAEIQQALAGSDTSFSFAVVGDPQSYYAETDEVLDHVEAAGDLRFAVLVGDLSDQGLQEEFTWYANVLEEFGPPSISLIGNHDHLGNARSIYEAMFGPRNQVFHAGGTRFVLFDNVAWESRIPIDFAWLEAQLAAPFSGPTIVFMHIHPTDVQLAGAASDSLDRAISAHQPTAVFMGHLHSYATGFFSVGTPWTTAPWPRKRGYLRVTVRPDTVYHQLVELP
jgi:3',5'-cyclic-AMP phosphodiesterase